MIIQKLTKEQIPALAEIIYLFQNDHWQNYGDFYQLTSDALEKIKNILEKSYNKRTTHILLAIEDDKIVGYVYCRIDKNIPIYTIQTEGYISGLYVLSSHQKLGYAKALMRSAMQWFSQKNVDIVTLRADVRNHYGREFWRRQGYSDQQVVMTKQI